METKKSIKLDMMSLNNVEVYLNQAFDWSATKEGNKFWSNVSKALDRLKTLPDNDDNNVECKYCGSVNTTVEEAHEESGVYIFECITCGFHEEI